MTTYQRFRAGIFTALLCLGFALAAPCQTPPQHSDKVLILHSYHAGFPWTDEILAGILSEFRRIDPHFEPFVEYLDWKRFPSRDNMESVTQSLLKKYGGRRFEVVIASDNAALDFALSRRKDIFQDTPIVFCGINGYSPAMRGGHADVTGVVEDLDIAGTLQAVSSLLPAARKVLVPIENTETGQAQRDQILNALAPFAGKLQAVFLDNPTLEDIFAACKANPANDTVLLLVSFGRDRSGRIFPDFGVDLLSSGCDTPIFAVWDFLVGKGAVGGSVLSGKLQGLEAARLALRTLAGEKDIPVATTSPVHYSFDQNQLTRFGISTSRLPKGSFLVNEPVSFLQRYRDFIPLTLTGVALISVALILLAVSVVRRRRVESELDKTKALLTAAIEHSPAGIMVAEGPEVLLSLANPAAQRILGIPPGLDRPVSYLSEHDVTWTCFKPDGTPYKVTELALPQTILSGKSSDNLEMRVLRPDGQEGWILISASPIRDRAGEIIAGMIVFVDITSRKRMEDMVIQSEKMMSLGGLAAGMAHEINNPLGIIVHSAQNALRRVSKELPANEKAAAEAGITVDALRAYLESRSVLIYLSDIIEAGQRASRIVRGMLGFSRPRSSERSLIKVSSLLDKALELAQSDYDLKKNYDIKKIRIDKQYDPADPSGMFMETEIIQVFLNIIKNAAQATGSMVHAPDSPPFIRLSTRLEGGDIRVDIEDNGPGMDERTCKRIMEPFFTTKQVGEGTGLGLSVTYFIVTNSYGGTLFVSSDPGKGTVFTVRLPRGRGGLDG